MITFLEDAVQATTSENTQTSSQKKGKQGSSGMGLAAGVGGALLGLGAMGSYALHNQYKAKKAELEGQIADIHQKEQDAAAEHQQTMQNIEDSKPFWSSWF